MELNGFACEPGQVPVIEYIKGDSDRVRTIPASILSDRSLAKRSNSGIASMLCLRTNPSGYHDVTIYTASLKGKIGRRDKRNNLRWQRTNVVIPPADSGFSHYIKDF